MNILSIVVGPVQTNCYVAVNDVTHECVIIDPGANGEKIVRLIKRGGFIPAAAIVTHGHFDHVLSLAYVCRSFNIASYGPKEDESLMRNPHDNGFYDLDMDSFYSAHEAAYANDTAIEGAAMTDKTFDDGDCLDFAGITFRCISTPGHTRGSSCLYCEKEKVLFSGDTLFFESAGRCDLKTGNEKALLDSLTKLFGLPEDITVYPGHGFKTSIGYEKKNNVYAWRG